MMVNRPRYRTSGGTKHKRYGKGQAKLSSRLRPFCAETEKDETTPRSYIELYFNILHILFFNFFYKSISLQLLCLNILQSLFVETSPYTPRSTPRQKQ